MCQLQGACPWAQDAGVGPGLGHALCSLWLQGKAAPQVGGLSPVVFGSSPPKPPFPSFLISVQCGHLFPPTPCDCGPASSGRGPCVQPVLPNAPAVAVEFFCCSLQFSVPLWCPCGFPRWSPWGAHQTLTWQAVHTVFWQRRRCCSCPVPLRPDTL